MVHNSLELVLRTHDSSRVADVTVPSDMTTQQLIETCTERWKLLSDREYAIVCERLHRQLPPREPLGAAGVQTGDEVVVYPLLEAGGGRS